MAAGDGAHRFDHVVSVMFENRSFDNLLGYLYEPGEVAAFEGVAGRDLSNPIPSYAPGAERGTVPVHVATSSLPASIRSSRRTGANPSISTVPWSPRSRHRRPGARGGSRPVTRAAPGASGHRPVSKALQQGAGRRAGLAVPLRQRHEQTRA